MMSWFSKINPVDIAEKARRISELEREIERYADALKAEREATAEFKKKLTDTVRSENFEFDFDAVKVFSVERNFKDNVPCTIIGYLLPEPVVFTEGETSTKDVVREWYLYCDSTQHEKIIEQFKASKK
jgi:hypothetical protein